MKTKNKAVVLVEIAVVLCSMFLVALPGIAAAASEIYEPGPLDVFGNANEDDIIDMRDTTYIKLVIFGKKPKTDLADANYDGKISMLDVGQVKLIIFGMQKQLTVEDDFGEAVTFRFPIERFIYHGHNAFVYETLRAIGVEDRLVGITDRFVTPGKARYSENYFPELVGFTNVGILNSPDYEVITELKPDAVITDEESYLDREKMPGIPVIAMDVRLKQFTGNTRKYGYIFDKREEAEEYINWRNGWENVIKERTGVLSEDEKPLVFGAYPQADFTSFWIWGGNSPEGPPLVIAGGRNIGEELEPTWPQVDREWIIERNPGVIIFAVPVKIYRYDIYDPSEVIAVREQFLHLPEFAEVDAVKNTDVHIIHYAHFMVGGATCLLAEAYFAKWFHPKLFEDIDPEAIKQEYVTRFQHSDFNVKEHGVFVYPPLSS